METHAQQNARHREVVAAYYETHDEHPLGALLAELRPVLLRYVRGNLGVRERAQAADVVQDALLELLLVLRKQGFSLSPASTLVGLSYTLCAHAFSGQRKRYSARTTRPGQHEDPYLLLGPHGTSPAQELPLEAELVAAAGVALTAATKAVLALPPKPRTLLILHFFQGLSSAEAAERMGTAPDSHPALLARALKLLRQRAGASPAPPPEVYARLAGLDTGDLFQEPLRLAS